MSSRLRRRLNLAKVSGTRDLTPNARAWKNAVDFAKVKNPAKLAAGIEFMMHAHYDEAGQIMYELDRYEGPHWEARFFAAILAREARDFEMGIGLMHEVVEHRPKWTEALYNLGVLYEEIGDYHNAERWFTAALNVDADFASAWINLGNMKLARGAVELALDCFDRALALVPDQAEAMLNASHALLMLGEWPQGWTYYEKRWETPAFRARNGLQGSTATMWDGSPLNGKTLLVFNEQGFGDTLIMLRFAEQLRELGARLIFRVPPRLVDLVAHHLDEGDQVIDEVTPLPPHDAYVPFMSLPYHLGTKTTNVPGAAGYLYQDCEKWGTLSTRTSTVGMSVGIVWAGSPLHVNDRNRSMTPALIAPLLRAHPDASWTSLQVGPHEAASRELGLRVPQVKTFHDTAEALLRMDLLITVDTATAHLAGAMGIPTWLCIPAVPDMRWPIRGAHTPWYDSVRIFRQPTLGDWRSVVSDLHKALGGIS